MLFLVDAQLPPAPARLLERHGHTAEHVFQIGMAEATDRLIWDHAPVTGAVIVTKDEDFALRRALVDDGPPIVWVRKGNTTRRQLLQWLEPLLPEVLAALARGERLVEIA